MTLLSDVVRTSTQVSGTPGRLAKLRELAACLGRLEPEEIRVAIPYLSGEIRQGAEVGEAMMSLRTFMFENVYLAVSAKSEHPRRAVPSPRVRAHRSR